jgi:predicted PurR-regulated permease PerM
MRVPAPESQPSPKNKLRHRRVAPSVSSPSPVTDVALTVSWTTIIKVIFAAALVLITIALSHLGALIFFSLLLALALWEVVHACTRRGLPKWVGVSLSALIVLGFLGLFVALLFPAIANQGSALISHLPEFQKQLVEHLPSSGPIRDAANKLMQSASFSDPKPLLEKFMTFGGAALTGISELLVVLVIAIYFLIDGQRIYRWLAAFLPPAHRAKVRIAAPQIVDVVSRYVSGQFITSCLAGIYAFAVLSILHVPNAVLLAVLAAVFDILPVIGFFLFVIPAVGLAFTVSPLAAGLAASLYGAYHLLETYLIVPKVYGDKLKLSTLTVLLSCLAGWALGGVLGAIAILPIVACYPIVEKLWLEPHLEPDTVDKHDALEKEVAA